ncbi:MAG: alpha/beta hydrolase [Phycisphaerae bacterium]|nr:alpha/beta hydrolase [Phycisphaerae bacterium]
MRKPIQHRLIMGVMILTGCAVTFSLLDCFTCHAGETVILLMPPALGVFLWWGWAAVRRICFRHYIVYIAVMVPVIAGAEAFAAHMAGGRLLWMEVFWALYFVIAWRMVWALWKRTEGRLGERTRRWGRRARHHAGGLGGITERRRRRWAAAALLIRPARFCLTALVFAPLVFGSLIHRIKIGNPTDPGSYADWPLEEVTFETDDGLTLSGWFLPEESSNATVVICHGAGANKGNFVEFMNIFHGRGYSSLIFDFRGHGASAGHTSTFGLFETADVTAAVDWLKERQPEYARHVFGLGSSMGAMALVRSAAQNVRIEAVVLDSCYVRAPLLARQHLGHIPLVGPMLADLVLASMSLHAGRSMWELDAGAVIGGLAPRPVLLIHGEDDFVIPPVNMTILYDLAKEPKQKWLGPGLHSNIMTTDFHGYTTRVINFFDKVHSGVGRVPPAFLDPENLGGWNPPYHRQEHPNCSKISPSEPQ